MRAAQIKDYGDADVVTIEEVAIPTVSKGKVLVEVYASSLNPFDSAVRAGYLKDSIALTLPVTLGGDVAGVVSKVGEGVTSVQVGDAVYGQANVVAGNSGGFAEFALTVDTQLSAMPGESFTDAAALPLVGVSALQAITEELSVTADQTLLIQGGAGGVGAVALQIAKDLGAYVAVTVDTEDVAYARSLGADEVIDYKTQRYKDVIKDYDAVFDTVGGDTFVDSYDVLKSGGKALSMVAPVDQKKADTLGIVAKTQLTQVTSERLAKLRELVESGKVFVRIDSVFPLASIQAAFKKRESNQAKGKIVLDIKQS